VRTLNEEQEAKRTPRNPNKDHQEQVLKEGIERGSKVGKNSQRTLTKLTIRLP